jgi:hypothetical protein
MTRSTNFPATETTKASPILLRLPHDTPPGLVKIIRDALPRLHPRVTHAPPDREQ